MGHGATLHNFVITKIMNPKKLQQKNPATMLLPLETLLRCFLEAPIAVSNVVFHCRSDGGGIFIHQSLNRGQVVVDTVFRFRKLRIEVVERGADP
jgi:hypothetical protein